MTTAIVTSVAGPSELVEVLTAKRAYEYDIDRNPVKTYLDSLTSQKSKSTMKHALRVITALLLQEEDLSAVSCVTEEGKRKGRYDALEFPWHLLRYPHTQAIKAQLQVAGHYSFSTVNRMLSALRRVLKECWRLEYIDHETMAKACDIANVKGETVPPAVGRCLSISEIMALEGACSADSNKPIGIRDSAIIGIYYGCGVRRAELPAINLEDVDTDSGQIIIKHGKGRKERTVYIANGALTALKAWIKTRGAEPGRLFLPMRRGGHLVKRRLEDGNLAGMTPQTIYDMLARRADEAGLVKVIDGVKKPDFSPHDLRRTYITTQWANGVPGPVIQKMAGHANLNTTAGYDRSSEEAKRDAASAMNYPYIGRLEVED